MEKTSSHSSDTPANVEHARPGHGSLTGSQNLSTEFENPLARFTKEELIADVDEFCRKHNLVDFRDDFRKGALIAQSPTQYHPDAHENAAKIDDQRSQCSEQARYTDYHRLAACGC